MDMVNYSDKALSTDLGSPTGVPDLVFGSLCLCEEAGELAGKIKKIYRDKSSEFTAEDIADLMFECGDVLWYLNRMAEVLRERMTAFTRHEQDSAGVSGYEYRLDEPHYGLDIVAQLNLKKLASRARRGMIHGSGDKR